MDNGQVSESDGVCEPDIAIIWNSRSKTVDVRISSTASNLDFAVSLLGMAKRAIENNIRLAQFQKMSQDQQNMIVPSGMPIRRINI